MSIITWKSCYETGIATFDAEHRALVEVVNELYEAMREKRGDEVLGSLLSRLVVYTKKHFQHEEDHMLKHHYPNYDAHLLEHQKLKKTIVEFQEQISTGYTGLSPEVFKFLREWLLNHIVETDMHMGEFLRAHSIYDCGPPAL
nr:bacteriohemerythrin [uncultured Desulfuromonas sp.]